MSVLLLNASYEPLRVIPTHRAVRLVVSGKAVPVEDASHSELRTGGGAVFALPSVIRLIYMVVVPYSDRPLPISRKNISARDNAECQVVDCPRPGTTVDHVVPRSRGGAHTWNNVVLMCGYHNHRKGSKLLSELGWKLKTRPVAPRAQIRLLAQARASAASPEWETYLAWAR